MKNCHSVLFRETGLSRWAIVHALDVMIIPIRARIDIAYSANRARVAASATIDSQSVDDKD
jgi:hypothetical protein